MLTREFVRVKTTAGAVRYGEQRVADQPEAVGTVYLRKEVAAELGNPERIKIAIADPNEFKSGEADA